jgi:hypothetical protein
MKCPYIVFPGMEKSTSFAERPPSFEKELQENIRRFTEEKRKLRSTRVENKLR